MIDETLLKKEARELLQMKERDRGRILKTHFYYIQQMQGEKGLDEVKKKLKELGCLIDLGKISSVDWYPIGVDPLIILVAKELFLWQDQEIFNMGSSAPKYSFTFKFISPHYFTTLEKLSLKVAQKIASDVLRKHYTIGSIKITKFKVNVPREEKEGIIKIENFKVHPILCHFFQGYIFRMIQFITGEKDIMVQETKCPFKGDSYHEFIIKKR